MPDLPHMPGLLVRPVTTATEMIAVRALHASCYLSAGYVTEADLDSNGFISDDWVPYSDYFAAIDTEHGNEVVGTCRMIRPSVRGFPAFEAFPPLPGAMSTFAALDPTRCVEVSALATPRTGMQNMAISAALYGLVWQESIKQDRAYMLAVMDTRLLRIMKRWFHFPFEMISPATRYMGSESMAVSMFLPRTVEFLRDNKPDILEFFSGNISFSDLDDFAVDLRSRVPEHRGEVLDLRRGHIASA